MSVVCPTYVRIEPYKPIIEQSLGHPRLLVGMIDQSQFFAAMFLKCSRLSRRTDDHQLSLLGSVRISLAQKPLFRKILAGSTFHTNCFGMDYAVV